MSPDRFWTMVQRSYERDNAMAKPTETRYLNKCEIEGMINADYHAITLTVTTPYRFGTGNPRNIFEERCEEIIQKIAKEATTKDSYLARRFIDSEHPYVFIKIGEQEPHYHAWIYNTEINLASKKNKTTDILQRIQNESGIQIRFQDPFQISVPECIRGNVKANFNKSYWKIYITKEATQ